MPARAPVFPGLGAGLLINIMTTTSPDAISPSLFATMGDPFISIVARLNRGHALGMLTITKATREFRGRGTILHLEMSDGRKVESYDTPDVFTSQGFVRVDEKNGDSYTVLQDPNDETGDTLTVSDALFCPQAAACMLAMHAIPDDKTDIPVPTLEDAMATMARAREKMKKRL